MADTFQLEIATPEQLLVDEQVASAELPGKDGYFGVLAGHAPLLSALGAGVLSFEGGSGGRQVLAVDGGFVEVFENHVRVLADSAEYARQINGDAARRELEEANQKLKTAHETEESEAALRQAERAQARLDALARA
ncbi:MAG TPA: ATP synthase F1 subunit epsilon [Bryobacteraceae bacterium]|jgi:F-type H+-transporting ATPase subunit epsilon|nr:ATP synthase F1 subunit epsilon [Bryobacteraceae bacterium]